MDWHDQLKIVAPGMSLGEAVAKMNKLVTPCPERPKFLGLFRRDPHKWVDMTMTMNTFSHSTLDRCSICGLLSLRIGDY